MVVLISPKGSCKGANGTYQNNAKKIVGDPKGLFWWNLNTRGCLNLLVDDSFVLETQNNNSGSSGCGSCYFDVFGILQGLCDEMDRLSFGRKAVRAKTNKKLVVDPRTYQTSTQIPYPDGSRHATSVTAIDCCSKIFSTCAAFPYGVQSPLHSNPNFLISACCPNEPIS